MGTTDDRSKQDLLLLTEYEADLQLRVLGVTIDDMVEPILDLGCGEHATLVRHLREYQLDATGLDQFDHDEPFVRSGDWLDESLGAERWGTILSHMAWSNRFLQHHLDPSGHPERYAKRYMEILAALKRGGSFIYSPGLPFIERLLPREQYDIKLSELPELSGSSVEEDLRARYGTTVFYSSRVTKLGEDRNGHANP